MKTLSSKGAAFIAAFEGFRASCYDDAAGNCTIGFGHLVHYGRTTEADRKRWGTITRGHALQVLDADARTAVIGVRQHVKVALTQGQFDALVSFAYNCGAGALRGSVGKAVNSKPRRWNVIGVRRWHSRVRSALLQWDHAGGRALAGLARRREAEAALFATGKYTT